MAAIKIQQTCNASKDFQLRIGIHLGEVVFENDDVFGDGVNVASRIQAVANPGSIYVSESVRNNVSNKKDITTQFVKTETLKKVKEPVKIYQVTADGVVTARQLPTGGKSKQQRKILLVLTLVILLLVAGYFLKIFFITQKSDQNVGTNEATENQ